MATFLFDKIIFGPIKSRRLGNSLGVNILSESCKICNFNCIYCECGWTTSENTGDLFPAREVVTRLLEEQLIKMINKQETFDVITFAGNGEPTMHPDFSRIIDDTVFLRDKYFPAVNIAVLSNATLINNSGTREALKKVDLNILKLDSGFPETIERINQPVGKFDFESILSGLKGFGGKIIIQTMFIRGTIHGSFVDNTTPSEVDEWIKVVKKICPSRVMIYSIARETPMKGLEKITIEELENIAGKFKSRVNIPVDVAP